MTNEKRKIIRSKKNESGAQEREELKQMVVALNKKEEEIDKQMLILKKKKFDLISNEKKLIQEEKSLYAKQSKLNPYGPWPILNSQFQILKLLGKGGFSEVYLAYDLERLKFTACKLHTILPHWDNLTKNNYLKYTLREITVFNKLNHPHIVEYYESFQLENGSLFTILEYCEGKDLDYYLKRNGRYAEKEAKNIIKQIISALEYLDQQNPKIIHYDIKPQNILFDSFGNVKLTDFGLCKLFQNTDDSKMELTSQGVGTYWYLPPECFFRTKKPMISNKVDVWSLGVVTFQMLYGIRPFGNKKSPEDIQNEGIILKSKKVIFPDKPNISQEMKNFIIRCLEYDQDHRINISEAAKYFSK